MQHAVPVAVAAAPGCLDSPPGAAGLPLIITPHVDQLATLFYARERMLLRLVAALLVATVRLCARGGSRLSDVQPLESTAFQALWAAYVKPLFAARLAELEYANTSLASLRTLAWRFAWHPRLFGAKLFLSPTCLSAALVADAALAGSVGVDVIVDAWLAVNLPSLQALERHARREMEELRRQHPEVGRPAGARKLLSEQSNAGAGASNDLQPRSSRSAPPRRVAAAAVGGVAGVRQRRGRGCFVHAPLSSELDDLPDSASVAAAAADVRFLQQQAVLWRDASAVERLSQLRRMQEAQLASAAAMEATAQLATAQWEGDEPLCHERCEPEHPSNVCARQLMEAMRRHGLADPESDGLLINEQVVMEQATDGTILDQNFPFAYRFCLAATHVGHLYQMRRRDWRVTFQSLHGLLSGVPSGLLLLMDLEPLEDITTTRRVLLRSVLGGDDCCASARAAMATVSVGSGLASSVNATLKQCGLVKPEELQQLLKANAMVEFRKDGTLRVLEPPISLLLRAQGFPRYFLRRLGWTSAMARMRLGDSLPVPVVIVLLLSWLREQCALPTIAHGTPLVAFDLFAGMGGASVAVLLLHVWGALTLSALVVVDKNRISLAAVSAFVEHLKSQYPQRFRDFELVVLERDVASLKAHELVSLFSRLGSGPHLRFVSSPCKGVSLVNATGKGFWDESSRVFFQVPRLLKAALLVPRRGSLLPPSRLVAGGLADGEGMGQRRGLR